MATKSKRHVKNTKKVDRTTEHTVEEAVALLATFDKPNFDETVEISMKLGVDTKKADQQIRGTYSLPNGIGKTQRVIAFAEGERAKEAEAAGADFVGGADLVKKVQDGWLEFDVAVTTPDMMKHVGKLGRQLGPKGLMPSPKGGTVTQDLATAIQEFKAGKIEYRADALGNINAPVGKRSFPEQDLVSNINAFIEHILENRPAAVKGRFLHRVSISASMSPGIRLAIG